MGHKPELPGAAAWVWGWQERAACARLDPGLFFHPVGERGEGFRAREHAAKRVCATCPVLDECREYALLAREPYGVWGGLGENERAELMNRHRSGSRAA